MKRFALLFCMGVSTIHTYAQEKDTSAEVIWLRNTSFYFTNSFYFGDNMIADAHRLHNMGAEAKLGIVRYKNIGIALFAGFTKLKVNDTQMIGAVNSSTEIKGGGSVFYQWEVTEKSTFKPEIGLYDLSFTSSGKGINIESMSGMGFLIGTDYQYQLEKGFRGVIGLHYHWNDYNINTASQYKKYFERTHYIQLSVGFNF